MPSQRSPSTVAWRKYVKVLVEFSFAARPGVCGDGKPYYARRKLVARHVQRHDSHVAL